LLGRHGEQPDRLDQELGDVEPDQVVPDRDGQVQRRGQNLTDDDRLAAVQPIGQRAGEGAQEQVGQEPGEDDPGDSRSLYGDGLTRSQLLGQGGGGQQA